MVVLNGSQPTTDVIRMHCCVRDLAAAYDGNLQTSDRVAGVPCDSLCPAKVRGGLNEYSRAVVLIAAREEGAESSAR
jgi:hypothetical protein